MYNIPARISKKQEKIDNTCLEIYHEKVYSFLTIFTKYVGGCHRKRASTKSDASANLKFMNWLLADALEYTNYEQERSDRLIIKQKLKWLLPLLQKCNGDINFVDKNEQSILLVFLAKYMPSFELLKKEDLIKVTDVVEALLQEGASVNHIDIQGNTPLHIAAKQRADTSIIKMLLENFTEVNICDEDENTVLHILLKVNKNLQDHTENIKILIARGTNIHKPNKQGSTPVHLAVERCNIDALRIFEKRGINFSLLKKSGRSMLHLACDDVREKSTDKLREATIDLLLTHKCDINAVDWDGRIPLHYAAKYCSTRIITKLIELGSNKLHRTKKYGYTPLHLAAQFGRLEAIKTLIELGIDVNVEAKGGITPLHLALLYSEWSYGTEAVEILIHNGADVYRRETIFDFTPLHMVAFTCGIELELLLRYGVDVNFMTKKGITPLHLASILGNLDVLKMLIDHGANLHYRDKILESTALHWVSRKSEILNMKSMKIDGKCALEMKAMDEFWSTLFVRRHKSYFDLHELLYIHGENILVNPKIESDNSVAEMLLRLGAFVNVKDDCGHLPLYYVFKNCNIEGLQTLLEFGGDVNNTEVIKVFMEKKAENEKLMEEEGRDQKKIDENKDDEAAREKRQKVRTEERKHIEVLMTIILKQVIKFKAVDLPIAHFYEIYSGNEEFLRKFYNANDLLMYFDVCLEEVEKMKTYMVENKISLYDLLHMDFSERSIYAKNITTHNLKSKFPEYCNIIRVSCREAIDRMHLLDLGKLALVYISKFHLPELCSNLILSYLDNESLKTLNDVSCVFEKKKPTNAPRVIGRKNVDIKSFAKLFKTRKN